VIFWAASSQAFCRSLRRGPEPLRQHPEERIERCHSQPWVSSHQCLELLTKGQVFKKGVNDEYGRGEEVRLPGEDSRASGEHSITLLV
jgi:hypothetical protein